MRKKLHLRYWIAFGFLALLLMSFTVWNIIPEVLRFL